MNLEKFRNKLVVFEGEDHCGKTTVAKLLVDELNKVEIPAIFAFQPGDNDGEYNQILSDMCKTKKYDLDPLSNLFAFLLDRSIHTSQKIKPALDSGMTVICDRWWYSTIAYQFHGKQLLHRYNLNLEFAEWVNKVASHNLSPDVAYYFSRPIELVESTENDDKDLFETESEKFKKRVKDAYLVMVQTLSEFRQVEVDQDPSETLRRLVEIEF